MLLNATAYAFTLANNSDFQYRQESTFRFAVIGIESLASGTTRDPNVPTDDAGRT